MNIKYHSFNCLITILFITILSNASVFAQSSPILGWSKKYGTAKTDAFHSIIENSAGEIVAVGTVKNSEKDKIILFAKINPATGELIGTPKELGKTTDDFSYRIIQTKAKGYAIVGHNKSTKKKRKKDFLLLVDSKGKKIGENSALPSTNTVFYEVVQNKAGDLYLIGQVEKKACLFKYTSSGALVWQKYVDSTGQITGLAIKLTVEEDIIIAISQKEEKYSYSTIFQRIQNDSIPVWQKEFQNIKVTDLWIESDKIAATGILYSTENRSKEDLFLWTINLDGQKEDSIDLIKDRGKDGGNALLKSKDGFYYTAGYNRSFKTNINYPKLWVSKMEGTGKEVYPDYYLAGGHLFDTANDIIELQDGSLLIAGQSESTTVTHTIGGESQTSGTSTRKGAWLMKLFRADYTIGNTRPPITTQSSQNTAPSKSPISITWINDLEEKVGRTYKATQPITMKLRAISTRNLKDVKFTIALNDSEDIDLTNTKDKSDIKPIGAKSEIYEITFDPIQPSLKEGLNTIYIKENNVLLRKFSIKYTFSKPKLHLVSIGVPYDDDELDYTSKDAKDFANVFDASSGIRDLFKEITIDTLTSEATTTEGYINNTLLDLSDKDVNSSDYIIIFISAHGLIYDNEFLILASDYQGRGDVDAVNFNKDVLERLDHLLCKKIIFIDACNSGKGVKSPPTTEMIIKLINAQDGFYIMSSSSAKQKSYENPAWENGAFTESLIEAFTRNKKVAVGKEDPIQANQHPDYLTLSELFKYTKQRVSSLAKSKDKIQTPAGNKAFLESDLPIFWFGN